MAYKEYENGMVFNAPELNALQELIQADVEEKILESRKLTFPIGSRYITESPDINPSTILGFGTWERFKGLIALGVDEDDEDLNEIGKTGGEKTHTLTIDEMASHNHIQKIDVGSDNLIAVNPSSSSGITRDGGGHSSGTTTASKKTVVETENTGGNQTHNNMQPFEVVGYMWIRRA